MLLPFGWLFAGGTPWNWWLWKQGCEGCQMGRCWDVPESKKGCSHTMLSWWVMLLQVVFWYTSVNKGSIFEKGTNQRQPATKQSHRKKNGRSVRVWRFFRCNYLAWSSPSPLPSMYGIYIYTYIYHKNQPNVGTFRGCGLHAPNSDHQVFADGSQVKPSHLPPR